ncbi:MAG: glucuronyl hydrolase, partial [Chitinophagaceae bacterium]|nr:glucuronyl hydrolase [Chitinophagaceae bacterium]
GFLLKHSVGHFPAQTEVDVPLTYADYYFVEAMMRYKALFK